MGARGGSNTASALTTTAEAVTREVPITKATSPHPRSLVWLTSYPQFLSLPSGHGARISVPAPCLAQWCYFRGEWCTCTQRHEY